MKVEKYGQYKSKCIIETSFKLKGVGKNGLTMEKLKEVIWVEIVNGYTCITIYCQEYAMIKFMRIQFKNGIEELRFFLDIREQYNKKLCTIFN